MHDMTSIGARGALTRYEVVPVKGGKHPGTYSRCFAFSDGRTGGGKLCVCYARYAWRMNGLHIQIRLVVLSNFHVQSFPIRATDYLILIFKVLIHFLNVFIYLNLTLSRIVSVDVVMMQC